MKKTIYLVLVCITSILYSCENTTQKSPHLLKSASNLSAQQKYRDTVLKINRIFQVGDSVTAYFQIDTTFGIRLAATNRWATNQQYFNELSDSLVEVDFVITRKELIYTKEEPRLLDDIHFLGSITSVSPSGIFYGNDRLEANRSFEINAASYGRCFEY